VGESMPVTRPAVQKAIDKPRRKPRDKAPRQCGGLPSHLVPLDPRHGVFPNLVMTPLMATWHALQSDARLHEAFWIQANEILEDFSDRRFNVFMPPVMKCKGQEEFDEFTVSDDTILRIERLRTGRELWAVFGYTSCFGLLLYLLRKQRNMERHEVVEFATEFVNRATDTWQIGMSIPVGPASSMSSHLGYLHRLCTVQEFEQSGARMMLQSAVLHYVHEPSEQEHVLKCLRSLAPFLHDDAYKTVPIGNHQKHFLLTADPESHGLRNPARPFWRLMGDSIKNRLNDLA